MQLKKTTPLHQRKLYVPQQCEHGLKGGYESYTRWCTRDYFYIFVSELTLSARLLQALGVVGRSQRDVEWRHESNN